MEVKKVGVVGLGLMGHGIAQIAAMSGYEVIGRDVTEEICQQALRQIKSGRFGLEKLAEKGKIAKNEIDEILNRITTTTDLETVARDVDIIIEAIPEKVQLKQELFEKLDEIASNKTIFATNTSSIMISRIAEKVGSDRKKKFIGTHFFSPAQVMKLVEITPGGCTTKETIDIVSKFIKSLNKTPVVLKKDCPGFVTTRSHMAFFLEAVRCLEEGLATPEEIDTMIRLGFNYPMGLLDLADVIGLDTLYEIAEYLYSETGNPMWKPPNTLKTLVLSGNLGKKTGKGFYDYKKEGV